MIGHQISGADAALKFILGGNAVVTFKSQASGSHLTYRVRAAKEARPGGPSHFVSVRTGGAGEKLFAYIGYVKDGRFVFGHRKAKFDEHDAQVRGFSWAFCNLATGKRMPPGCEVWHENRCGRCARALTDPDSIASGFGPECIQKTMICEAA